MDLKMHLKLMEDGKVFEPRKKGSSGKCRKRTLSDDENQLSSKRHRSEPLSDCSSSLTALSDCGSDEDSSEVSEMEVDCKNARVASTDEHSCSTDSDSEEITSSGSPITKEHLRKKVVEKEREREAVRERLEKAKPLEEATSQTAIRLKKNIASIQKRKNALCSKKRSEVGCKVVQSLALIKADNDQVCKRSLEGRLSTGPERA
jgi:hypothetical protein